MAPTPSFFALSPNELYVVVRHGRLHGGTERRQDNVSCRRSSARLPPGPDARRHPKCLLDAGEVDGEASPIGSLVVVDVPWARTAHMDAFHGMPPFPRLLGT